MTNQKLIQFIYFSLPSIALVLPLIISMAVPHSFFLMMVWAMGFIISAAMIFILRRKDYFEVIFRGICFLTMGFLIATIFHYRFYTSQDWLGVEESKVTHWKGVLESDSRSLDFGRVGYSVRCQKVGNGRFWVSADCSRFFVVKSSERLLKGQPVSVEAGMMKGYLRTEKVEAEGKPSRLWELRGRIIHRLSESFLIEQTASGAFFEALLLGSRDELNSVLEKVFKDSGCLHLIALSGMHLGILIGLIRWLLGKVIPLRWLDFLLIPLLGGYVILTGSGPSLKRAYMMFVVAVLCQPYGRRLPLTEVICLSLGLFALLYPLETQLLGMRLSFAAVFGIAFFSRPIQTELARWLPTALAAPLGISYGAQLAVSPFLFGLEGLNPGGLFASIIVSPLLVLFMYLRLGVSALFLGGFTSLAQRGGELTDMVYGGIVTPLVMFARIPTVELFPVGFLFYLPLVVLLFFSLKRGRMKSNRETV